MDIVIWTLLAFLSGAVPYSVLIGRWVGKVDIRTVGDHNPGATNVMRALDKRWFAAAFLLDTLKGAVPVGLAWFVFHIVGWGILPVALAPCGPSRKVRRVVNTRWRPCSRVIQP